MKKLWYAVVTNNDPDYGYGSYNKSVARKMAIVCAESGKYSSVVLVTVEDIDDPIAIDCEIIA